jgi:hypothetical protein
LVTQWAFHQTITGRKMAAYDGFPHPLLHDFTQRLRGFINFLKG